MDKQVVAVGGRGRRWRRLLDVGGRDWLQPTIDREPIWPIWRDAIGLRPATIGPVWNDSAGILQPAGDLSKPAARHEPPAARSAARHARYEPRSVPGSARSESR